jgi:hypothetical protein
MPWSDRCCIQDAVHRDECFPTCELLRREHAVCREGAVQAEGYEKGLADDVPVRESSAVVLHPLGGAFRTGKFSGRAA